MNRDLPDVDVSLLLRRGDDALLEYLRRRFAAIAREHAPAARPAPPGLAAGHLKRA